MIPYSIERRIIALNSMFNDVSKLRTETAEAKRSRELGNALTAEAVELIKAQDKKRFQEILSLRDFDEAQYDAMLYAAIRVDNVDLFQEIAEKSGRKAYDRLNFPGMSYASGFLQTPMHQVFNRGLLDTAIGYKAQKIAAFLAKDPMAPSSETSYGVLVKKGLWENFKISGGKVVRLHEEETSNYNFAISYGMPHVAALLAEHMLRRAQEMMEPKAPPPPSITIV